MQGEVNSHAWWMEQAEALRAMQRGEPAPALDTARLIEELDAMAVSEERRVESLARRIIEHLLMLQLSPAERPRRGWQAEVTEFRAQLEQALTATLERHLGAVLPAVEQLARRTAARKLRDYGEDAEAAAIARLPGVTLAQVIEDWFPAGPGVEAPDSSRIRSEP